MLFHMSIDADDPRHVAEVLAQLLGGEALPFPPVAAESWIAMVDDGRGTAIEVYPRGTVLVEAEGDRDATSVQHLPRAGGATHIAMATAMEAEDVFVLAAEQGWPARYRRRDDVFGVIEVWVERALMIEVLTPGLQAEYLATFSIANWRAALDQREPLAA